MKFNLGINIIFLECVEMSSDVNDSVCLVRCLKLARRRCISLGFRFNNLNSVILGVPVPLPLESPRVVTARRSGTASACPSRS